MSYAKRLCIEHRAQREMRIAEWGKKKKGFSKNFLCYGEPTRMPDVLEDVGVIATILAETKAEEAERLKSWKAKEEELGRMKVPHNKRSIPSSPEPGDKRASVANAEDGRVSSSFVRYVRPSSKCRRERLFAYHMAKKVLEREQRDDCRRPTLQYPALGTGSVPRTSFNGSSTESTNFLVTERGASVASTDVDPWGRASHITCDGAEKAMYNTLRMFVADYEERYGRKPRTLSERECSSSLSLCTAPRFDFAARGEEGGDEGGKAEGIAATEALAEGVSDLSRTFKFPLLQDQKAKTGEGVGAFAPFAPATYADKDISFRSTVGELALTGLFQEKAATSDECAAEQRLGAERERRRESVQRLIRLTLKRLSHIGHYGKPSPSGATCTDPFSSEANSPLRHSSFFSALWDMMLDKRIGSAPHEDMVKLAEILSGDPGLQKCSEAAARFVTYVLMRSLPEELFTGDPEDYRVLRRRVRLGAKNKNLSCPKPESRTSSASRSAIPSRKASPKPMHLRFSATPKRGDEHGSVLSMSNSVVSSDNGERKDNCYFLHRDTSSCQQVLQSVALRHGYWLSSTERMLRRPPFHACGLPLRAARDIALWQRPPSKEPSNCNATLNATNATKESAYETSFGSTVTSRLTKTTCLLEAEARLFEGSLSAEDGSALADGVTVKGGGRPKTIAPLLVFAHGGYGVAPFSVPDAPGTVLPVEREVDSEEGQGYRRHLMAMDGTSIDANQDAGNAYFSLPEDFLHPEPSLLPLHSVMQTIYSSVRQNRNIFIDDAAHNSLPIVLDLLMDVVESYEDFFQSIIDTSFEPAGMRSFFLHTYREMILSWAAIVVCETAIEYATERVAEGPTGKTWIACLGTGGFTDVQLENIALSGLVQKTFPSVAHLSFDEDLLRRTMEKVRDVVLGTIVRVRGELYYLVTGVDNRRLFFEQYHEMLREEKVAQEMAQARIEKQMTARFPGCPDKGGNAPPQQEKTGSVSFPLDKNPSLATTKRNVGPTSHGSTEANQGGGVTGDGAKRNPVSSRTEVGDRISPESTVTPPKWPSRGHDASHIPEFELDVFGDGRHRQGQQLSLVDSTVAECPSPRACPEYRGKQLPNGCAFEPHFRVLAGEDTASLAATIRPVSRLESSQRCPRKGPLFARSSAGVPRRHARRLGGQNDVPQELTVRSVRRELVSLHIRRNNRGDPNDSKIGAPRQSATQWGICANSSPTLGVSSFSFDFSSPTMGSNYTTFPESREVAGERVREYSGISPLALSPLATVVGNRQACMVEQMRRSFQNTVQFQVHFQEAPGSAAGSVQRALHESQWYVTGNSEYYERRTVALIRRSRQVAAFDLRHLSPITTLGMCVQRSSRGAHRYDAQAHSPHGERVVLQPKDLHLGRNIVPWTL